jgi:hypothetical protein
VLKMGSSMDISYVTLPQRISIPLLKVDMKTSQVSWFYAVGIDARVLRLRMEFHLDSNVNRALNMKWPIFSGMSVSVELLGS